MSFLHIFRLVLILPVLGATMESMMPLLYQELTRFVTHKVSTTMCSARCTVIHWLSHQVTGRQPDTGTWHNEAICLHSSRRTSAINAPAAVRYAFTEESAVGPHILHTRHKGIDHVKVAWNSGTIQDEVALITRIQIAVKAMRRTQSVPHAPLVNHCLRHGKRRLAIG